MNINNPDFSEIETRLKEALQLAMKNAEGGHGGPFGCVIYKNGLKISEGVNRVTETCDPTSHAEINAIRDACKSLHSWQLTDCEVYASSEPCPMCMAALYWARPVAVYFANSHQTAAEFGFDDSFIYEELKIPMGLRKIGIQQVVIPGAESPFVLWKNNSGSVAY